MGSEMCIRDRAQMVAYARVRGAAARGHAPRAPRPLAPVAGDAVSWPGSEVVRRARRPRRGAAAPSSTAWALASLRSVPLHFAPGAARQALVGDAQASTRTARAESERRIQISRAKDDGGCALATRGASPKASLARRRRGELPSSAAARPRSGPSPSHPSTAPSLTRAPSPALRSPAEGACRLRDRDRRRRRPRSPEQGNGPRLSDAANSRVIRFQPSQR